MPNTIINRRVTLSGGYVFTAQALAYFSYLTVQPSLAQKIRLDKFIFRPLISAGYFSILDRFYLPASELEQHGTISLVNPSSTALTLVNTPTFTQYEGWTGNTTTMSINTNFTPVSLTNYVQDSATNGIYIRTNPAAGTKCAFGASDAGTTLASLIITRNTGDLGQSRINSSGAITTFASTSSTGLWVTQRTAAADYYIYKNGVQVHTQALVSTGRTSRNMFLLAQNSGSAASWFDGQISCFFMGSGAIDQSTMSSIINGYMTQLGKNVY